MSKIKQFSFIYSDSKTLTISDKSFLKAVEFLLKNDFDNGKTPLYVVFKATHKILYFDENLFQAYVRGEIELPELIAQTECDGLYRNTVEIVLDNQDNSINEQSLWKLVNKQFILIDNDRYIAIDAPDDNFLEIK